MSNEPASKPPRLPPDSDQAARLLWDSLSPADRQAVEELIRAFPSQTNLIQLLLKHATNQVRSAFGSKHHITIVGPANVGKSTLFNRLIRNKEDRAEVGPIPGTTRENQKADAGLFQVVDTPGADAAGDLGERERELALTAAADADFLIIMFDAVQGIKRDELELFEQLAKLGNPYIVVMNKIDLVRRDKKMVIEGAAKTLRLETSQIIPISARGGENLEDVLIAIAMAEPRIVAALGQALPQYRWQLAWRSIVSAASASAAVALSPIPLIDFVPLIAIQSVMVLGIARIYNYQITLERARELVATFGMGFLGRMLFQQLSKVGGVPGWLLGSAIAASTTVVMGYAASVWFETGERLSSQALKKLTTDITGQLLEALKGIGKRKPKQQSLKEHIEETLSNMPIGENRTVIDEQVREEGQE
jgi:GTPase